MQKYKILNKIFHITMGNKMGRGWRQNKKQGLVRVALAVCWRAVVFGKNDINDFYD